MAQYNNISKKDAKALNNKQTVLIETIEYQKELKDGTKKTVKEVNVYLNNSKRRSEAYYGMFKDEDKNFAFSKKKDLVQKSYRLLKFFRALEEIGEAGAKEGVKFFKSENYVEDVVVEEKKEETLETPAEEVEVEIPKQTEEKIEA